MTPTEKDSTDEDDETEESANAAAPSGGEPKLMLIEGNGIVTDWERLAIMAMTSTPSILQHAIRAVLSSGFLRGRLRRLDVEVAADSGRNRRTRTTLEAPSEVRSMVNSGARVRNTCSQLITHRQGESCSNAGLQINTLVGGVCEQSYLGETEMAAGRDHSYKSVQRQHNPSRLETAPDGSIHGEDGSFDALAS